MAETESVKFREKREKYSFLVIDYPVWILIYVKMSRRLSNGANDSPYHIQLKQRMSSTPARNSENDDRNKPIFCIENSPSMTDIRLSRDLDGNSHFQ